MLKRHCVVIFSFGESSGGYRIVYINSVIVLTSMLWAVNAHFFKRVVVVVVVVVMVEIAILVILPVGIVVVEAVVLIDTW